MPTWHKIALSASHPVRSSHNRDDLSGVIVMPDETLRVCHTGMLSAVTLDGTIPLQLDLCHFIPEDWYCYYSLPTALQTGETLLVLPDALLIVDRSGIPRRENRLASDDTENAQRRSMTRMIRYCLLILPIAAAAPFGSHGGSVSLARESVA